MVLLEVNRFVLPYIYSGTPNVPEENKPTFMKLLKGIRFVLPYIYSRTANVPEENKPTFMKLLKGIRKKATSEAVIIIQLQYVRGMLCFTCIVC